MRSFVAIVIICVVLILTPLRAWAWESEDEKYDLIWPRASHWEGLTHTATYREADDCRPFPGEEALSRLKVEWREPVVTTRFGNVQIRGRLMVVEKNGKETPVDWFQGLRVLVATTPGATPDWVKGHTKEATLIEDTIALPSGRFAATFHLKDIKRAIGSHERFQVGLSLGKSRGRQVTWQASQGALAGSVSTIAIAGAPRLSPELQMINAASFWPRNPKGGMALVRAVNGLHALGKEKAVTALREYVQLSGENWNGEDDLDPANIETGDHECVFWIIRVLFEPARAGTRIPEPMLGAAQPSPNKEDERLWPLFPVELVDDVPFMLAQGWNLGGRPEHPGAHITWAERYGVLRAQPLRPGDPLAAAERLASQPKAKRLWRADEEIKKQAWRMVVDVLPKVVDDRDDVRTLSAAQWKSLRDAAVERKLSWDPKEQRYAVAKQP